MHVSFLLENSVHAHIPVRGLSEGQARLEMSVMRLSDIGGLLLEAHRCSQALIKSLRFSVSSMNDPLV